jgi:hypothetical protein
MKKIFLFLLTIFVVGGSYAQSPQGMNYQAVIRDDNGIALSEENISLKVSILQSSTSGNVVYSESHSIQTNSNGLVNLIIGKGNLISGNFTSIPWDQGPYFLEIEFDPEGGTNYTKLGTSQLMSVPYALYSQQTGKLSDYGSDTLFVVKDKQGKVVFAVFPDGAKVYVDSTATKGRTGGFAVSGRSTTKKGEYPIFFATSDSTHVFVEGNSGTKGRTGGFAVSGRSTTKTQADNIFLSTPDSTRVYVNQYQKGKTGGFAVSGRSTTKGAADRFLDLTPDNYFIGHQSGNSNLNGKQNVFLGYNAGHFNTEGWNNIFLGYKAGYHNVGYQEDAEGSNNIFIGTRAGYNNLGGSDGDYGQNNVFIGKDAGFSNENGPSNIFIGTEAGYSNIGVTSNEGGYNVFLGYRAGKNNLTGAKNVFLGTNAGGENESSSSNVYIGENAGGIANGGSNAYIGKSAGYRIKGSGNTFFGAYAGNGNTDSTYNVLDNTFVGNAAGGNFKTGSKNIILGTDAGYYLDSASHNVFIGSEAGKGLGSSFSPGSGNVFIGYKAGMNETGSNKLYIENSDANSSNSLIYGDFDSDILQVNGNIGIGLSPVSERLEIDGALKIGNTSGVDDGIIRWTGSDFEGRKSGAWVTLTNNVDGYSLDADGGSYEDVVYVDNTGNLGVGNNTPLTRIHVQDEKNGFTTSSIDSHVAVFENTLSTSKRAPVLALKIGTTETPSIYSNYITFFDGNDSAIGAIQGNGSGGIELNSGSADFAEYLPKINRKEIFKPYEVVGIIGGKVTKNTEKADLVSVITNNSIVTGNNPGKDRLEYFTKVSFMGQVPVKVKGEVNEGDYILPSGNNDGIAIGKSPEEIEKNSIHKVIGVAWEKKNTVAIGPVTTYISLNSDRKTILRLMRKNNKLEREIDQLNGRLQEIESRLSKIEN